MVAILEKLSEQPALVRPIKYDEMSDADLVFACQQRDTKAFEYLLKRHERSVYAILHHLAPEWSDTSDLAQEVFLRVWRSIGSLRKREAFKTWLYQIVTNLFYDELRERRKFGAVSLDEPVRTDREGEFTAAQIADTAASPDEVVERRELEVAIKAAMNDLPQEFRIMILLREMEGFSYNEIARLTGTELGTVKSRISRARQKMHEKLLPFLDSYPDAYSPQRRSA
ncbi:MAG TPA: sigma-70 family RNA polymerase sigma factor [Candidatus Obscuribacterales bacterium]